LKGGRERRAQRSAAAPTAEREAILAAVRGASVYTTYGWKQKEDLISFS